MAMLWSEIFLLGRDGWRQKSGSFAKQDGRAKTRQFYMHHDAVIAVLL